MYFNANVNVTDEQYLRTYNVMRLGDIAFEGHSNKEFSHGRFVENYIGDGIVSHIFTVLRPRVPFDVNYWRYAINNEKLMRLPLIRSTKASTMMHDLVPSDFLREAIPTPTLAEQMRIGAFLVGLDSLITLHQRKCQCRSLCGYLSWEQRKLGEIIQLGGSGGTPSATNPNYYGGEIPFLSIADIEGRDIVHTAKTLTKEGLRNSAAWIVPAGAVSLAMYASVGKVGIIRQDTATSQAFYNMVSEDVAIRDFVFTRLEKADASFEWEPYISTGTQRNLNADKVKAFAIAVPGSREAAKIGRYFANLDSLITLHQ